MSEQRTIRFIGLCTGARFGTLTGCSGSGPATAVGRARYPP